MLIIDVGMGNYVIALIFLGFGYVPSQLTCTWPMNVKITFANSHFLGLSLRLIFFNLKNKNQRCYRCSSQIIMWTFKSFTNTFKSLSMHAPKTSFIVSKKVLVAFFIPNGMIVQSNDPNLVMRVDLHISSKAIWIFQNLDLNPK